MYLLLLALAACAPLSAATMSERCSDAYDACLNGCRPPPGPPPGLPGQLQPPNKDAQIDLASCTHECNRQAQSCR